MKKYLTFFTAVFLVLSISLKSQNDTTNIVIIHTNDMHSNIDKISKMAYIVKQYEQKFENVFVFSAGDLFTGNPIVDKYKNPGYPMIDLMNHVGYDITCFGNHEFDVGQVELNNRIEQANFPFICANFSSDKSELNQPNAFHKFQLKNGISIGVLGLIQLEKNGIPASSPLRVKEIEFYNPFTYVKNYTTYKDSADIFILLSHLGIEGDKKISDENTCFDIIIGGHSHTKLFGGLKNNETFIVQAGSRLKYVGVLTLKVFNGEIVEESDTLIDTRNIKGNDSEIDRLVNDYNNNPFFDEVIGIAQNDIIGSNELGALMTDAMRDTLNCDIAFQNIGGIRTNIFQKGNITKKMIYSLSPFGNVFVIYKLNVEQIKELIKYSYYLEKSNEQQVSGITVELYLDDKGDLNDVKLFDKMGKDLVKGTYTVAINDYMASAYVLDFLQSGEKKTNIIDAESTMNYIKKKKVVDYTGIKRVKVIQN